MKQLNNMEFMRKIKVLVLLLFSISSILFVTSPQFTGWVTDSLEIYIGILAETEGCLSLTEEISDVYQNSVIIFPVKLDNCGSTVLNGTLYLTINNSNNTTSTELNSTNYSLPVLGSLKYNFSWTATESPGTYCVDIRDNETNETVHMYTNFNIVSLPTEPRPPSGGAISPLISSFLVDVPEEITMYKDSNKTFLIKVTNNGETALSNIILSLTYENITIRKGPEFIPSLNINSSVVFFIEIDASNSILDAHSLVWEISAGGINKTGYTQIRIITTLDEEVCRDSILYYIEIMDVLKDQINKTYSEGKNVTYLRQLFDETMYELVAAQTFYKIEYHGKCIDRLERVRTNVELLVIELSRAKQDIVILLLPFIYETLLISLLSLMVVLVVIFVTRKAKKYRHTRIRRKKLIIPKKWD